VYCVVPSATRLSLEGLAGVDPGSALEVITAGELTAVVSRVRLQEFGSEALKRNLEDLAWVERTARAHDAVLGSMLELDSVVPLRLLTIFTDEAHLVEMLERERDHLVETLDRLRGHAEWSVKLLADPTVLQSELRQRSRELAAVGGGEAKPGTAFFARKKQQRTVREEARALAQTAAVETHDRLRQHAAAARVLPPQHPDLSRRSGEMVLNGAYLVERSRTHAFAGEAEALRERHRGVGLELELSGPWAPYNFVTA
jgi:hypothetical protein